MLAVGSPITPQLTLVRKLGSGGMGSVWAARHRTLGTEVAVKFIADELVAKQPQFLERFQREA
ncbi:MAG: serine/threonine protein kinase, partial [Myxococcota bacterium]